jgi:hypothetical protein
MLDNRTLGDYANRVEPTATHCLKPASPGGLLGGASARGLFDLQNERPSDGDYPSRERDFRSLME